MRPYLIYFGIGILAIAFLAFIVHERNKPSRIAFSKNKEYAVLSISGTKPGSDSIWVVSIPDGDDFRVNRFRSQFGQYTRIKYLTGTKPDSESIVLLNVHLPHKGFKPYLAWQVDAGSRYRTIDLSIDISKIDHLVLSPDRQLLAFTYQTFTDGKPTTSIWIADLNAGRAHQITHPEIGSWDSYPQWRSDQKAILYSHTYSENKTLMVKICEYTFDEGRSNVIIGGSEGASRATYGDGNEILTYSNKGLASYSRTDGKLVRVIAPRSVFSSDVYMSGGIAWFSQSNVIVLPMSTAAGEAVLYQINNSGTVGTKRRLTDHIITYISALSPDA